MLSPEAPLTERWCCCTICCGRPKRGIDRPDHLDLNKLNCARWNLRLVNRGVNMQNQKVSGSNKTSFKGVRKENSKYRATICGQNLGMFAAAEEAARAYDAAARELYAGNIVRVFPQDGELPARDIRTMAQSALARLGLGVERAATLPTTVAV